jgi:RNA polymerase sigma-70 factor (ECF subfamily)
MQAATHTTANSSEVSDNAAQDKIEPLDIDRLYRDHSKHILRFVRRYLRRQEDAEDVLQNTFIEAMRCADRFSGLSKPSTWLFGIAINLARNLLRRHANEEFEEIDEAMLNGLIDEGADPAFIIEVRQIAAQVDMVLNMMQPEIKNTFEAVFDGLASYEEAAHEMDIPIGTVRSRVSRVRAAVRARCAH